MILGDFNARSPSWGCKILDSKGDQLEDLSDDLNLSILNTGENTYVSKTNGTASALDISAISYASANNVHWKVLDAAISYHFPVLTTLPIVQEPTTQEKRSWNFRKANWDGFTQELENLCSDLPKHNDAEKLLRLFTCCIQKAAKHHIPRAVFLNLWGAPPWGSAINEKDSIGQELQRNDSEELKLNFIEVSHRVEELILENKKEKRAELCSKLDPRKGTSQYWNLLKVLNSSYISMPKTLQSNVISIDGVNARTNKEAANMLSKQYEVTSRLNFAEKDRLQYKKYKSIIKHNKNHCAEDVFTSDFTLEELEYAIRHLNPKKSPGPDVIYGQMIVHFGEIAKKYLLNIFITSWRSGKLPKIWKSSVIIPILKPGKDATSCKSYRPISLTCILCKLMERIIHSHLIKFLTEQNFLHFYQTAYRANHSTVDQLFYLSQTIINGFQEKPHEKTVAVFLDLSSAFNRVW
ncbi:RNA-directed DNA polymerase from mobile element jockey [Trichonephila clavipes]|uniref:RNA-directed DNA polymerase from mobile element jockey n=1 Tax=Trichonephila clavipes TaxID=2585209 RepID=A0A8X6UT49_TRICX|nr:RNA-directed DNA polymerase from mobile element jockey [Trichonephila clavipes]